MVEAASRPATILKNKQPGHYMPLSEASPVPPIESLDRAVHLGNGKAQRVPTCCAEETAILS
jgi:hypothetical protein